MSNASDSQGGESRVEVLDQAVIRFAGDSGDGMQITGNQFTTTSAILGNDLATFPDFPAEIRAPAGTVPGVSGFQVRISSFDIHTPGDRPDVLVAMNPAALKVNIKDLKPGGIVIINTDSFTRGELAKAKYESNPLEDSSLDGYRVVQVKLTTLTKETLKDSGLDQKTILRCKNFFALGIVYWLYHRPLETTIRWLEKEFGEKKKRPEIAAANVACLKGGYNYADITGIFQTTYEVPKAKLPPGTYRNIQGNAALSLGLVAASKLSGLQLFLGSYPITPASDILHQLSAYKNFGVITFQAEDEIAAVCAAIGASYAGCLGLTTTSGPGIALKSEAMNLAVIVELPLIIVNVQRGGPSTGLPTKTEQSDLLQVLYGRNGDSPIPVLAASTPSNCFDCAVEAARVAVKYMTPVVLLSDGYLANGAEPWRLPKIEDLPEIPVRKATADDAGWFEPYLRDQETLARPWAVPGTPGLHHRVGGLEKADVTGDVSYDPDNHERMTWLRHNKVEGIAKDIAPLEVHGDENAKLLVLGWGSTEGAITGAVNRAQKKGLSVARAHLRWINPFPANLEGILKRHEIVLIPEMNTGQLSLIIQGKFVKKVESLTKIKGQPFTTTEILDRIEALLG
ncbi:MAG TPA: 2-oxoacid:acceptor oxidoreductase subunit alpha [Planctomycetes bacterium]|nr:2-oxoacid:acceptor oxidoreductase subunit alpha [Planctomycetota bacterium]